MPLNLSATFAFELDPAGDAVLQFEAAPLSDQRIIEAQTAFSAPEILRRVPALDGIGERVLMRAEGLIEVRYSATLDITRETPDLTTLGGVPVHQLPGESLTYLLDSNYCHASQFVDFTASQFGDQPNDGAKVAAIREWVANHLAYVPGASDVATTATDTFHTGNGICRDYAHLFITLARACAIPARYVACFAPGVTPQDFHAVAQVYLADKDDASRGAWRIVDPTGMADPAQTAIIGVGRDATDVSFLTSFGPMRFVSSEVAVTPHNTGSEGGDSETAPTTREPING